MLGNEGILGEQVVRNIFIRLRLFLILKCLLVPDGEPLDADPGIRPIMVGADLGASHCWRWWLPAGLKAVKGPKKWKLPSVMMGTSSPDPSLSRAGSQASGSSMSCWSGWASSWAAGWSMCTTRPIRSSAVGTSAGW